VISQGDLWNRRVVATSIGLEDLLDRRIEDACQGEGEGETRIEFPGLDGVDGLSGDLCPFGEPGLSPVPLGAENLDPVLHGLV
jgi:hypothetical protein